MKYFKITNLTTNEIFYMSPMLPNDRATHIAMSAHLNPANKYSIEEVSFREYCGFSCFSSRKDYDSDSDWDDDDGWENFQ